MRKFNLIAIVALFALLQPAFAQINNALVRPGSPNVYLEVGGSGGLLSLNFDRRFAGTNTGFGARIGAGLGYVSGGGHGFSSAVLTVPVALNYLTGKGPSHLEMGAGVTIGGEPFGNRSFDERKQLYFVPTLGYRYQPLNKGFTFRAFVSPFVASTTKISGGLSFGKVF